MRTDAISPRAATVSDVDAIVRLVNCAYIVESFFVAGNRITPDAVRADLATGTILVVDRPDGSIAACVYVSVNDGRGYFGMLAVDPAEQGRGVGHGLIAAAESKARRAGASIMTISVVNVRVDLLSFYARLGYIATGEAPYVHRPVLQPVHFVLMEKPIAG